MARSRREFLAAAGASLPALLATPALAQEADALPVTPHQRIGPFYPEVRPDEHARDLTQIAGQDTRAKGRIVRVGGRVLDRSGRPIGSAMVLVWPADAQGRYGHSRDGGRAAADPGFRGHELMRTAPDGSFTLTTIRPGAYADSRSASGLRTPHIHFEIIGESGRLITEMYFPGEPLNAPDANIAELKARGGDPAALTAIREGSEDADVLTLRWDVVLAER